MIGEDGIKGEAFIGEADLPRIRADATADFVADLPEEPLRRCRVSGVDRFNVAVLDPPYAASVYGGPLPARRETSGEIVPLGSLFRVRFDACEEAQGLPREMPGRVLLRGEAQSFAARGLRWMAAILRSEMTP